MRLGYSQLVSFGLILVFGMAVLVPPYLLFPEYRRIIAGEDRIVETATALAFLGSFLYVLIPYFTTRKTSHPKSHVFVSLLGMIAFLDEISFGERLLDLQMPHLGSVKIDGVHDFAYFFSVCSAFSSWLRYLH
jgi:hypothetical protein